MIWLGWGIVALLMAVLWVVQIRTRNAGWVDFGWAAGIGALSLLFAALAPEFRGIDRPERWVAGALGAIWALRLSLHLWPRLYRATAEDPRYARFRDRWGSPSSLRYFALFQAQAGLAVVLSLPFYFAAVRPEPAPPALLAAGVVVWLLGFAGEWVADTQLSRFKRDPANSGKVCAEGLWRYSRHPNYFFEWVLWIGHGLLGLGAGWAWLSLASPVVMGILLVRVTGIPPAERQSLARRGERYRAYQRSTSAFIPWPPRVEGFRKETEHEPLHRCP